MSRKRKKRLTAEAARLLCQGKTIEEAIKETGLAYFDVQGMDAFLHSKRGREWAVQKGFLRGSTPSEESTTPQQKTKPSTEALTPSKVPPAITRPKDALRTTTPPAPPLEPEEVVVEIEGIPSAEGSV